MLTSLQPLGHQSTTVTAAAVFRRDDQQRSSQKPRILRRRFGAANHDGPVRRRRPNDDVIWRRVESAMDRHERRSMRLGRRKGRASPCLLCGSPTVAAGRVALFS